MQRIVSVVLVPALEAHKLLAQATCLNVSVAESSRALGTFPPSFMRTSSRRAFHGSHPFVHGENAVRLKAPLNS